MLDSLKWPGLAVLAGILGVVYLGGSGLVGLIAGLFMGGLVFYFMKGKGD